MTRRCPGASRAARQVFYGCVCQCECPWLWKCVCVWKREWESWSCWHHWKGTQLCVGGCKEQCVQFMLCVRKKRVHVSLCAWGSVSICIDLCVRCRTVNRHWLMNPHTSLLKHTHTNHSLTHIHCTAVLLPCCDPASRGQLRRRSPGAQEGHRQVWLETDPGLRKACSYSEPIQLSALDAVYTCILVCVYSFKRI